MDGIDLLTSEKQHKSGGWCEISSDIMTINREMNDEAECGRHIDLSFYACHNEAAVSLFSAIQFRNFYTYEISFEQRIVSLNESSGSQSITWLPLKSKHKLMRRAHYEDDALAVHCIFAEDFTTPISSMYHPEQGSPLVLRLLLFQPSPLWSRRYSLEEITGFSWCMV